MQHKKVILITIDCLRADHLSCYGYERKTSPFIDYLAAKGMKFENAFANGPNTPACFRSILASGYPFEFVCPDPLAPNALLISEILQMKGIRTAAIHSNPYLSAFYGYNRGWSYFQDFLIEHDTCTSYKKRIDFRRLIGKYLPNIIREWGDLTMAFFGLTTRPFENAETITKSAISWLNKNKAFPFFLWIHYMDLHEPYFLFNTKAKRKYASKISRLSQVNLSHIWTHTLQGKAEKRIHTSIKDVVNIYDDKLGYVDKNLGGLFRFLSQEGLVNCTLVILCSDHGQELLDHGHIGHGGGNFYDEILHIPLILFGSGMQNQVDRNLVSQLDIAPTILNFYGITVPKSYRGSNLLSMHTNCSVIAEGFPRKGPIYALRTEKWKYIWTQKNRMQLYNLENDRKETQNLIDQEEAKAQEFEAIIKKHILWEEKLRSQRTTIYEKERIKSRLANLRARQIPMALRTSLSD